MSIPMPPIELIKEGRVIGSFPATASYGNTKSIADCIRWLKGWHETLQTDFVCDFIKDGQSFKDYDAMRVKWFNENIVTWYLTGQVLLDGEVVSV